VPKPNADGLDQGGIVLPEMLVPLGTRTGFNTRNDAAGFPCRFRILDSSVPVLQSAKDRIRNNVSKPLDWARVGRVLGERNVSSPFVIIGRISCENSSKVLSVEHNQMIRALASDRSDQAFNISILPGRTE
jgi:hypothetical protein